MNDATIARPAPPAGFVSWAGINAFSDVVGPVYTRLDEERVFFGFFAEARHANPRGVVHGGMLMTLADQTLGRMVWIENEERPCTTISFNSNFLSGGRVGEWIECTGEITRSTRAFTFMRGRVYCGERTILSASGVWKKLGVD